MWFTTSKRQKQESEISYERKQRIFLQGHFQFFHLVKYFLPFELLNSYLVW